MKRCALVVVLLVLVAAPAVAQVAVNPTYVSFEPSADHNALALDGTPLVARYEFRLYAETGTGAPLLTPVDLGKPSPAIDAARCANPATPCIVVTVAQVPALLAVPARNTKYVAKVAALGATGEGLSTSSNFFGFNGPAAAPGPPAVKR